MIKKFLFLIVIIFMFSMVGYSEFTNQFEDVSATDWFYNDVKLAFENGIINGKTKNMFKPNDKLTYAEAIKISCCLHQQFYNQKITLTNGENIWYSTFLEYAKLNSIPYEFTDYNAHVTRSDFLHIVFSAYPDYKYYPLINNVEEESIPDVKSEDLYSDEIYFFYRSGIVIGNTKNEFKPNSDILRSEVSAIITRILYPEHRKSVAIIKEPTIRGIIINSKDLTDRLNIIIEIDENGYERISFPLLAIMKELGADIEYKETIANIKYNEKTYILDFQNASLTQSGSDENLLLITPGAINTDEPKVIENDLMVCYERVLYFFEMLKINININERVIEIKS